MDGVDHLDAQVVVGSRQRLDQTEGRRLRCVLGQQRQDLVDESAEAVQQVLDPDPVQPTAPVTRSPAAAGPPPARGWRSARRRPQPCERASVRAGERATSCAARRRPARPSTAPRPRVRRRAAPAPPGGRGAGSGAGGAAARCPCPTRGSSRRTTRSPLLRTGAPTHGAAAGRGRTPAVPGVAPGAAVAATAPPALRRPARSRASPGGASRRAPVRAATARAAGPVERRPAPHDPAADDQLVELRAGEQLLERRLMDRR